MSMIAFLNGTLAEKTPESALIEVAGVGYEAFMSQSALMALPDVGTPVHVLTYLQAGDSGLALYGFLADEEKLLFEQLITVGGVGPKVALAALSTFEPRALIDAVAAQDVAKISRIPGVGKKTASRIILELKGSLDEGIANLTASSDGGGSGNVNTQGAVEALLSMGFTLTEADRALQGAEQGASESEMLQYALKRLGS